MATPHATLPTCPACGAREKAVADMDANRWHCFNCHADGTIAVTITNPGDHVPDSGE